MYLYDWQQWWLIQALGERADGDWCARENVLITGRQSGKNIVIAALELAALFVLGDPLTIHSAHEVPTALKHFQFMLSLIDATPDLSRKCLRPVKKNGQEAIRLRSGPTLQFRARGRNSGRGLTAGRLVFDEAFKIDPSSMGALVPTMRAMQNTQITYASSAPKADSMVLHSLITRGRANDPADRLFYAEWGNPPGTAMDDVDAWYQANPSLGLLIEESTMHDEYRTLVSGGNPYLVAEFAREAVGIGEEPPSVQTLTAKIPADQWKRTAVCRCVSEPCPHKVQVVPGELTIGFSVTRNGEWSSIGIASGSMSNPYVEVIEHQQGVGWLPDRLVALVLGEKPIKVGCNGGSAAAAQVGAILQAFHDAGIPADLLKQLSMSEYKAACGGFFTDVVEVRLRRPAFGQTPLEASVSEAGERLLGDGFVWDIRNATVPVSPLDAVTVARALLPTVAKPKVQRPMFALT